jgi:hypothetical protein
MTTRPLKDLLKFPVMEAIFTRQARRFGLGMEIPSGPLAFKSRHQPLPLSHFAGKISKGYAWAWPRIRFHRVDLLLAELADHLLRPLERIVPPHRHAALVGAIADLEPRLCWWCLGTLASMLIVGGASWIGYAVVGLHFALPLALLAAAFEAVPTIDPLFAFGLAALVAPPRGQASVTTGARRPARAKGGPITAGRSAT